MRAVSFDFRLGRILLMLTCFLPSYLQAIEQQKGQELQDVVVAIPPPPPDDGEAPLEITSEILQQLMQVPNSPEGILVFRHKTTGEYWTFFTNSKELWIIPEGMTDTSWVKWPKLRKAAKWVGSTEPAAWLLGVLTVFVAVPTFLWAQPWTDTDPEYSVQTVAGMSSAGAIMAGLLPLTVICVDRHLNPKPKSEIRRYHMREATMTLYHMGEDHL